MTSELTPERFAASIEGDRELSYRLRGFEGRLRVSVHPTAFDIVVNDGRPQVVAADGSPVSLALTIPKGVLTLAASTPVPPGYESLSAARFHGAEITGDLVSAQAPFMGALSRLYNLIRRSRGAPEEVPLHPKEPLFAATDTAVGRYAHVEVHGVHHRIFYEEAGTGRQVLLLQHTAGADGRQWRHQLADPEFQRRFHMIAPDLPYHGRSLPPVGDDWWTHDFKPTKHWFMDVILELMDKLEVRAPIFLGCSVGGQLALDLATYHPERFAAIVALNGTLDNPVAGDASIDQFNDLCRDNRVSTELYGTTSLDSTSPLGPEPFRRELYWLYRSNFPGIYAGDNDYFLHDHDLLANDRVLDASKVILYALAGEFDALAVDPKHGSPAVARHFPGVEYRALPQLGHFAPVDDPLRLRVALLPILDEVMDRVRDEAIEHGRTQPSRGVT